MTLKTPVVDTEYLCDGPQKIALVQAVGAVAVVVVVVVVVVAVVVVVGPVRTRVVVGQGIQYTAVVVVVAVTVSEHVRHFAESLLWIYPCCK